MRRLVAAPRRAPDGLRRDHLPRGRVRRRAGPYFPEFAVADGIVQLTRIPSASRDERYPRVLKLRGSGYREGLHAFTHRPGGPAGVSAHRHAGVPPGHVPRPHRPRLHRASPSSTGCWTAGSGGGAPSWSSGPAGSGKTTLALGFALDGVRKGEPALYVNFQETPSQLARAIHSLGVNPGEAFDKDFHLCTSPPSSCRSTPSRSRSSTSSTSGGSAGSSSTRWGTSRPAPATPSASTTSCTRSRRTWAYKA